jgi:hypothetical protein
MNKKLDVTSTQDLDSDAKVFGDPDRWILICKASSDSQGWMKSTKAMQIFGVGCLVQVTTQQGDNIAEAITFVPGVSVRGVWPLYYLAK